MCDVLLISLIEKFHNEVDNLSTKDALPYHEVKQKFLNLYLVTGNGDLAHYTFGYKKNKYKNREPNLLVLALPNSSLPPPKIQPPFLK
jgi:hypothetical protein